MSARIRLTLGLLRENAGRTRLMIAAVALAVAVVGAIVGAGTVIDREIDREFAETRPPVITMEISGATSESAGVAQAVPGIAAMEARSEYTLRLADAEGWQEVLLIADADPASAEVGRAYPESTGATWPLERGDAAVERSSLKEVDVAIGDRLELDGADGSGTVTVTSLAYDAGRTPAWMNGRLVVFVAPETLPDLGLTRQPNRLLLTTNAEDRETNQELAARVVEALLERGVETRVLDVPEPGEHPAADVMATLLFLLRSFGVVAVAAAALLLLAVAAADVRRQLPLIGILKAQGAGSRDVAAVFLRGIGVIGIVGLVLAVPAGMAGTWALSAFALSLLNISASSWIAAPWVFVLQAGIAATVPVLAVMVPVARLARVRVRDALAADSSVAARRLSSGGSRLGRSLQLGWRNTTRQPGRLAMSVTALGIGAASAIAAMNTGAAWNNAVDAEFAAQDYSVQAVLQTPTPKSEIIAALGEDGQAWATGEAPLAQDGGDSGDTVNIFAPPPTWSNPGYDLLEGRWLRGTGAREAVATQAVTDPELTVGDAVLVGDDVEPYKIVGVIRQLAGGESGSLYVSERPSWMPADGLANAGRVPKGSDDAPDTVVADELADRLTAAGLDPAVLVTGSDAREALDDHLLIITGLLLVFAALLGAVGLVALVESLTTGVLERRGEYAVVKVLGASIGTVIRIVLVEAVSVTVLAWLASLAIAWPITLGFERAVGETFVGAPLPFVWWWPGALIALVSMLAAATVASVAPAFDAADTTAREALAGE